MSLDELIRSATSRAGIVRVRNALNPLLWLCAVASPLSFVFAYLFSGDPVLHYGLAGLGALPILACLFAYTYFLLRSPDRLQSEEFVLRQQEMTIIERKQGGPIPLHADLAADRLLGSPSTQPKSPKEQP